MSSKIDPSMLKNPDMFVSTSDHVFNFVEHHFKTVLGIALVLLLGGVGYVAMNYYSAHREALATEALYAPEAVLKKAELAQTEKASKVAVVEGKSKVKTPAPVASTEDFSKDYAPSVERIKGEIQKFDNTRAALVSSLSLSTFLLQKKQFADALTVLNLPKLDPGTNDVLGGFWLMQKGLVQFENNKVDEAIVSYEKVAHAPALKAFHPEANLKLGLCYEVKGDASKARDAYEKVAREFPETEAAQNAQQYLRLIQLK